MNQDLCIFQRRTSLPVRLGEFLDTGIHRCANALGSPERHAKTLVHPAR